MYLLFKNPYDITDAEAALPDRTIHYDEWIAYDGFLANFSVGVTTGPPNLIALAPGGTPLIDLACQTGLDAGAYGVD